MGSKLGDNQRFVASFRDAPKIKKKVLPEYFKMFLINNTKLLTLLPLTLMSREI